MRQRRFDRALACIEGRGLQGGVESRRAGRTGWTLVHRVVSLERISEPR